MKLLPLSQGKFAQVNDEDFEELSKIKWYAQKVHKKNIFYATRALKMGQKISLHRFLLSPEDPSLLVDHRDGDRLNCQRENLRLATSSQNQMNKVGWNKLGFYKGVSRSKNKKSYIANIFFEGKLKYIGTFTSEENAAIAYNIFAEKFYKEFAKFNIAP